MNTGTNQEQRTEIPLAVVGCDFRVASSALRQQLYSSLEDRNRLHCSIKNLDPGCGLMILETCNRIEWIVSSETPEWMSEILFALMLDRWKASSPDIYNLPCPYIHVSLGNFFEEPLKDIIERGQKIKFFGEYCDTCWIAEDRDFINEYIVKKVYGKPLPVPYNEVFTENDYINGNEK